MTLKYFDVTTLWYRPTVLICLFETSRQQCAMVFRLIRVANVWCTPPFGNSGGFWIQDMELSKYTFKSHDSPCYICLCLALLWMIMNDYFWETTYFSLGIVSPRTCYMQEYLSTLYIYVCLVHCLHMIKIQIS